MKKNAVIQIRPLRHEIQKEDIAKILNNKSFLPYFLSLLFQFFNKFNNRVINFPYDKRNNMSRRLPFLPLILYI